MSSPALEPVDLGQPTLDVQGIPDELKSGSAWCCWRFEQRNGKPTKVPLRPDGGAWRSNDPSTWVTFEAALAGFHSGNFDGIGRALNGDLIGVDVDWKHAEGPPPWLDKVRDFLGSWTETSPSGRGVHVWLRGGEWHGQKRQVALPGGASIEVYDRRSPRFFCVTGNTLPGSSATIRSDAQKELDLLASEMAKAAKAAGIKTTGGNGKAHDVDELVGAPEGERRTTLTSEAGRLRALGLTRGEAEAVLLAQAAKCTPPVPPEDVEEILGWAWSKPAGEPRCPVCAGPEPCPEHPALPPGAIPGSVVMVRASSVTPRPIRWLWYPRLAIGAVTWLEGPPSRGKSTLLLDLAARVSRGDHMPGAGHEPEREPADAIVLAGGEDSIAETMVPRLIAAGADLERIHFLTASRDEKGKVVPFRLTDDGERLAAKARELKAALILIDPLVCFMGSRAGRRVDSNNDLEVRQALSPLADLDASVVAIRHFRKSAGTDPLAAGGGSVAFSALTRIALQALADPEDPERNLLCCSKVSLVPEKDKSTLAYRLVPAPSNPAVARIEWGGVVDVTAADVLQAQAEKATGGEQLAQAVAFIKETLATGPMASKELFALAAAKHLKERTLWRAKTPKVKAYRDGDVWYWSLTDPHYS